jgi:prepilin-type processing-associated H-X9-DG protein
MRSQHLGGVNVGLVDGSAHFVSNDIETSGTFGDWGTVWDKYISSADGETIDKKPF